MIIPIKIKFYLFALLTCFSLAAQNSSVLVPLPTMNQINFHFVRSCCNQAQELRKDLLEILRELSENIDYWRMQKLTSLSYFISKGPTGWFSEKSQQQELNEKITFLKQALEQNAYYLGSIQYYLGQNYQEKSTEEIEKNMRELLLLIEQCVSYKPLPPPHEIQPEQLPKTQWAELLISNKKNLITFKKRMLHAYFGYKKPNHFRRNWFAYSATTIGALALATYAYQNQEQIKQWYSSLNTALNNYWQTHMHDPIVNSIETLTDKSAFIEKQPIDEQSVEIERQARNEAIRSYREQLNQNQEMHGISGTIGYYWRATRDFFWPRNKITETASNHDIEKEIEDANKGHIAKIIRDRNILMRNSIRNTIYGELPQAIEIELLHAKTQGTEVAKDVIETHNLLVKTLRSYRLIIELLALFPTVLLAKMLYNTGKSGLSYFNQKNNLPLKKTIRLLHRTLNKYSNTTEISYTDQGLLVFWVHELKKSTTDLPLDDQYPFIEDLNDLLLPNLTVEQKKSIIQRMYGTYTFLIPTA